MLSYRSPSFSSKPIEAAFSGDTIRSKTMILVQFHGSVLEGVSRLFGRADAAVANMTDERRVIPHRNHQLRIVQRQPAQLQPPGL